MGILLFELFRNPLFMGILNKWETLVRLTKVLALSLMILAATGAQAQSGTDVDGITSATQQTAGRQPRSHGPRLTALSSQHEGYMLRMGFVRNGEEFVKEL